MNERVDAPRQTMESYLDTLHRRLRGMNDADAREIVAELRSHITEKATTNGELTTTGVDAALAALGSPEELASQYTTDELLARAEVSRSPLRILRSLFHWASLSVAGFFVFLGTVVGYSLGVCFVLGAMAKPFHPQTTGLWRIPRGDDFEFSLRMGFGSVPVPGRELLGWWIVPLGLVLGCGLVILTTQFAVWCARRYRRSRQLQRG